MLISGWTTDRILHLQKLVKMPLNLNNTRIKTQHLIYNFYRIENGFTLEKSIARSTNEHIVRGRTQSTFIKLFQNSLKLKYNLKWPQFLKDRKLKESLWIYHMCPENWMSFTDGPSKYRPPVMINP